MTIESASEEAGAESAPVLWNVSTFVPYAFWFVILFGALAWRPPTAPVELETLASAWHMFSSGSVIPLRNGVAEPNIPPLLHWLILGGWHLFGFNDWWSRLIAPLAALATIYLTGRTANVLWPHREATPIFAGLLLSGMGGFVICMTMILPEMLALPFILLTFHSLSDLWLVRPRGLLRRAASWVLIVASGALAALAAGSAWAMTPALCGLLILAFDRGNSPPSQAAWIALCLSSSLVSLLLVAFWLLFASSSATKVEPTLFTFGNGWIDQATEAARREIWSIAFVPVVLYPWICWKTLWRALNRHLRERLGSGFRMSLGSLAAFAILGFASGWQLQALLPLICPLSLMGARLLATQAIKPRDFHAVVPGFLALLVGLFFFLMNIVPTAHLDGLWREVFAAPLPIWLGGMGLASGLALLVIAYGLTQLSPSHQMSRTLQVAVLPIVLMTSINLEFAGNLRPFFDLKPVAATLKAIQDAGKPVAVYGSYRGEFDFAGRLSQAPATLHTRLEAANWAASHPDGAILTYFDGSPVRLPALPIFRGVARDRWVAIWPASAITSAASPVLDQQF